MHTAAGSRVSVHKALVYIPHTLLTSNFTARLNVRHRTPDLRFLPLPNLFLLDSKFPSSLKFGVPGPLMSQVTSNCPTQCQREGERVSHFSGIIIRLGLSRIEATRDSRYLSGYSRAIRKQLASSLARPCNLINIRNISVITSKSISTTHIGQLIIE